MGGCSSKNDTINSIKKIHIIKKNSFGSFNSERILQRNASRLIDVNYKQIPNRFKRKKQKSDENILEIGGLVGLHNLGNTCFMNAAIQSLSNTQPLVDYIASGLHKAEINLANPLSSKGVGIKQLAKLIGQIWQDKNQKNTVRHIQPIDFLNCIQKMAPQFAGGTQEDAHEFLAYLLDLIHEDLNRVKNKPQIFESEYQNEPNEIQADESWRNYLLRNRSIIVDLFQGQQKSVLRCLNCGCQSHRFEPFMYLSVPVFEDQEQSLRPQFVIEDCIKEYCKEKKEKLTEEERWHCPKCNVKQDSIKKIDLWSMPNLLIIHLKRFKYTRERRCKLRTFIDFPLRGLNFESLTHRKQNEAPTYDLYSVINHEGTLGRGHYQTYSRNRDDQQWYEFNDQNVRYKIYFYYEKRQISEINVITSDAYLLFYYKNSVDGFMRQTLTSPQQWIQVKQNISSHPQIKFEKTLQNTHSFQSQINNQIKGILKNQQIEMKNEKNDNAELSQSSIGFQPQNPFAEQMSYSEFIFKEDFFTKQETQKLIGKAKKQSFNIITNCSVKYQDQTKIEILNGDQSKSQSQKTLINNEDEQLLGNYDIQNSHLLNLNILHQSNINFTKFSSLRSHKHSKRQLKKIVYKH